MDIIGYEGLYEISKNLDIVSKDRYKKRKQTEIFIKGRVLKQSLDSWGYKQVSLYKDANKKSYKVHRLIAAAFIPNPENKPCINHKNGIKTDNRVENLEWCTDKENFNHAIENNLIVNHGENNKFSKLTDEKIKEIFKLRDYGMTHYEISKKFKVSRPVISNILSRKYWKHVEIKKIKI